jgi:polar amino acid transport system substrate-binding protein
MLQQGRVDVFALSGLGTQDLLKKFNDENLELVMPVKGVPMGCAGAAFNPEDTAFREAYDKALAELKASGEFATIIEPLRLLHGGNARSETRRLLPRQLRR